MVEYPGQHIYVQGSPSLKGQLPHAASRSTYFSSIKANDPLAPPSRPPFGPFADAVGRILYLQTCPHVGWAARHEDHTGTCAFGSPQYPQTCDSSAYVDPDDGGPPISVTPHPTTTINNMFIPNQLAPPAPVTGYVIQVGGDGGAWDTSEWDMVGETQFVALCGATDWVARREHWRNLWPMEIHFESIPPAGHSWQVVFSWPLIKLSDTDGFTLSDGTYGMFSGTVSLFFLGFDNGFDNPPTTMTHLVDVLSFTDTAVLVNTYSITAGSHTFTAATLPKRWCLAFGVNTLSTTRTNGRLEWRLYHDSSDGQVFPTLGTTTVVTVI